jgi:hypothetical protein
MGSVELELSDILTRTNQEYVSDESLVILAHPRNIDLMISTVANLKGARRDITLSAHVQTEEDRTDVRKAFGRYWHRFNRIVWNDVSAVGNRTAVRFDNLEGGKKLYAKRAVFLDSDLDNRSIFFGRRGGESKPRRHYIPAHEWISRLFMAMDFWKEQGYIFYGVMDNAQWVDYISHPFGKRWSTTASNLSGVWPVDLHALRLYDPEYNPWERGRRAEMHYADDIAATHELVDRSIYIRLNYLSWDGDRGCYYSPTYKYIRDAFACRLLTDTNRMMMSQRKRWQRRPGGGQLVELRIAAEGIMVDLDTPQLATTIDEIFVNLVEENPLILTTAGVTDANTNLQGHP